MLLSQFSQLKAKNGISNEKVYFRKQSSLYQVHQRHLHFAKKTFKSYFNASFNFQFLVKINKSSWYFLQKNGTQKNK